MGLRFVLNRTKSLFQKLLKLSFNEDKINLCYIFTNCFATHSPSSTELETYKKFTALHEQMEREE